MNTCQVVGTRHVYGYWPPARFPPSFNVTQVEMTHHLFSLGSLLPTVRLCKICTFQVSCITFCQLTERDWLLRLWSRVTKSLHSAMYNPTTLQSFFFPLLMFLHCLTENILTADLSLPLLTSRGNIREIGYRNSFLILCNQTCVRPLRAIKLKKKIQQQHYN